jgi:hypothetical protein
MFAFICMGALPWFAQYDMGDVELKGTSKNSFFKKVFYER